MFGLDGNVAGSYQEPTSLSERCGSGLSKMKSVTAGSADGLLPLRWRVQPNLNCGYCMRMLYGTSVVASHRG